jgi:predicted GIY-YIG superfamily endonuclease
MTCVRDIGGVCTYFMTDTARKSYIGYTKDVWRRIGEHQGSRGAKSTRGFKQHRLIAYITGFPNQAVALSFEWHAKRHYRQYVKKLQGVPHPRLTYFFAPLMMPKFQELHHELTIHLCWEHDESLKHYLQKTYEVKVVTTMF